MAKTKLKTNSGTKKRFKMAGGKTPHLRRRRANRNHILTKKGQDRKRRLRGLTKLKQAGLRGILRLLGKA